MMIDAYLNMVDEPTRLQRCPAIIRALGQAAQRKRERFIGAAGEPRERMPMAVIAAGHFLRLGGVGPGAICDILYRQGPAAPLASNGAAE